MSRHKIAVAAAMLTVGAGLFAQGAGSEVADAVMRGDAAGVRRLIQQKADVNVPQMDGATALHWAVYRDNLEMADLLLSAGANVAAANREGATVLAMAALYGNPAMVERLLKAGADAKQRGPNGETMVMYAARNGNPDVIKLLVAAGADVNAREGTRRTTALMWAVTQRNAPAVEALIELGAEVDAKSGPAGLPRNRTVGPINAAAVARARAVRRAAAEAGRTIEEQIRFEEVSGATFGGRGFGGNQAGQDDDNNQAGNNAAARPAAAVEQDDDAVEIVAGLVGGGSGGLTPLIFAAREGALESARLLLDAGADVNQPSDYGWTPLLTAVNNRNYQFAKYLIERGADVNLANKGGWTPLYLATDNRNIEGGDYPVPLPDLDHLDIIKLLLERGADTNARVRENTLQRTIFTNQWFIEAGATPFIRAAQSSDVELMKLFLAHGADPKATTDHGDNALTATAGIGWVEGVVYERSVQENTETARLLLDLGLDPNHQNNDGRTALMGAAHKGRNDIVQMLVDRGARLDIRDKGSRDTGNPRSAIAGHTWQALDYADGLVRFGVQSAVEHKETAALIRKLMTDRGLPVPPPNRTVDSICVVEVC